MKPFTKFQKFLLAFVIVVIGLYISCFIMLALMPPDPNGGTHYHRFHYSPPRIEWEDPPYHNQKAPDPIDTSELLKELEEKNGD